MSEKQIKLNVSWVVPWFAGFLFTVGFADLPTSWPEVTGTAEMIASLIAFFFGWPLVLGAHLGGNL